MPFKVLKRIKKSPKSLQMVIAAMKLKDACLLLGRKVMTNLDSIKGPSSQSYGFTSSHVWMCELDYKES